MDTPDQTGAKRPDDANRGPRSLDRDPAPPPKWAMSPVNGRVLDPSTALVVKGVQPRSTVYVGPRLTISRALDFAETLDILRDVADELGWDVDPEGEEDPRGQACDSESGGSRSASAPAGSRWRRTGGSCCSRRERGTASNGCAGSGSTTGLLVERDRAGPVPRDEPVPRHQPVPCDEPRPGRAVRPDLDVRRPGLGRAPAGRLRRGAAGPAGEGRRSAPGRRDPRHRLRQARLRSTERSPRATLDGLPIGYDDPITDPELHGDLLGQLDGVIDPFSGHGTFIAGLVHQACPDADLVVWRAVPSDGPIVESDPITALAQIAELARRHRLGLRRAADRRAHAVDGLLPRDSRGRAVRPDHVRDPRGPLASRHGGGVLGRERGDEPAVLPGGVRPVVGRPASWRSRTACRSCPSAP